MLLSPCCNWWNRSSESFRDLMKLTQCLSNRTGVWKQLCWCHIWGCWHSCRDRTSQTCLGLFTAPWPIVMLLFTRLYPTLCDPLDCSPPGSSVHGILQAGILEWVAVASSRGPSRPRDGTRVSCTAGGFFTSRATGEAPFSFRLWALLCSLSEPPSPTPLAYMKPN